MPTPSAPSSHTNDLIYDRKLTSVVPAKVTGEGRVHPLSPLDMSNKSNNVKGLYVFENTGLQAGDLKAPMFKWLVHFVVVCGRIRVAEETGEVVIKMNDAGIRLIEAKARVSVEEWLEMEGRRGCDDHGLVPERGEVGDGGVVLVIPGSKSSSKAWDSKLVTVILPEHELEELKTLLKTRWDIQ